MSTLDVPGANPANRDELHVGCWAEHADGSLVFVISTEHDRVAFQMYSMQEPVMMYAASLPETQFKDRFSWPPTGHSTERWTWHDKTPFPIDRVMSSYKDPRPVHADVRDLADAARRVARELGAQGRALREEELAHQTTRTGPRSGFAILHNLRDEIARLFE